VRAIGFSTGAIARGRFEEALALLRGTRADAVELSALRLDELDPLISRLSSLDLRQFCHVSVHAPSRFGRDEEPHVVAQLQQACAHGLDVVVHPDAMLDPHVWAPLGNRLCLENMDKRKPTGRTVEELDPFFAVLPSAGLCFDIAHARQVDGSMTEAYRILTAYTNRIRQVHVSEVNTASRHARVSEAATADFREVIDLIPLDTPVINEALVNPADVGDELEATCRLFAAVLVSSQR
jgi:hypothetical protein